MKLTRPRAHSFISLLFLLLLLSPGGQACGPGRGSGRRRRPRKLTPLVYKQHVPNVSENTLGASGLAEGPISRNDPKFKDLVRNDNPDIKFKDEEGTGADRIMTQRCKDKLNTLAISVMNQWPGVKLRVTEAWDERHTHAEDSLHYEGRAVDITTSDRDKAKYGMLARLAVEAGFDWVYYESRSHIHCSVKSDSSVAIKIGGCFPGTSDVITAGGVTKAMSDVKLGEHVLSVDEEGRPVYSEVIAFLDRDPELAGYFVTLTTDTGHAITLTAKHLIFVSDTNVTSGSYYNITGVNDVTGYDDYSDVTGARDVAEFARFKTLFAEEVRVGQVILVVNGNQPATSFNSDAFSAQSPAFTNVTPARVTQVRAGVQAGVYAPLTSTGRIVVDGVVTSCYAFINNQHLAHAAFAPMRGWHELSTRLPWLSPFSGDADSLPQRGIHLYAKVLYDFASLVLSRNTLYVP